MQIDVSSGAKKRDVRNLCYRLTMKAGGDEDARELALLRPLLRLAGFSDMDLP